MRRTAAPAPALAILVPLILACLSSCESDPAHVRGSGTIEMDETDIASLVGGRLVRLRFNEGDSVHAGDTLAVLDRGELIADLEAQTAQAERAQAQWRDLKAGPRRQEVDGARAELAAATAQWELAAADLKRMQALFDTRAISAADLDRARTARDQAAARREAAAEQVRMLEAGYRRQQVVAAANAARAALAELEASRSRAGELVLTAPVSGVVLLRNYLPGELVPASVPVLTLGNPDSLWMRVYVATPQMGRVRLGAPVEVRVLGIPRVFRGRVVEIASKAEFTPRAALTEEEQANLVFGVKVALEPSGGTLKAGLPAEARILPPAAERVR